MCPLGERHQCEYFTPLESKTVSPELLATLVIISGLLMVFSQQKRIFTTSFVVPAKLDCYCEGDRFVD